MADYVIGTGHEEVTAVGGVDPNYFLTFLWRGVFTVSPVVTVSGYSHFSFDTADVTGFESNNASGISNSGKARRQGLR
jgi:hypothetical protein